MRLRDWRVKAVAQRAFSAVPGGYHVNYLLQRTVGGLPVSDAELTRHVAVAVDHLEAIRSAGGDPATATTFEFGAGYDLHMPLIQRCLGVREQRLVDIRPVVRRSLVLDVARRLPSVPHAGSTWAPLELEADTLPELLAANGIFYQAPADARRTALPAASVDAVVTTSTLEHIPPEDLAAIYAECRRILVPGGVMTMLVDYSDHWSHFDPTITPYNFLRFDDQEWARWSPALMYQNRLRHDDHVALLEAAGFAVEVASVVGDDEASRQALATVPLAAPFRDRDPAVVALTAAHLVARRAD